MRNARSFGVLAILALVLTIHTARGDEEEPPAAAPTAVPDWAKVAPEQIAEAERLGVPVAFENGIGMRFVLIPGGKFLMGSPEDEEGRDRSEGPQHEVTVAPFYLAVTEVTNAQYRRFKPVHDSQPEDAPSFDGDAQPVVFVSQKDATAFVRWLSERESGAAYRLPSEAEWEYGCRAGTTTPYWSGETEEDVERVGWYFRNSGNRLLPRDTERDFWKVTGEWACRSHPVGLKPPNPWGLHDMHGNVREWCEDGWHHSYRELVNDDGKIIVETAPVDGSAWEWSGSPPPPDEFHDEDDVIRSTWRVIRGGDYGAPATSLRSAARWRADRNEGHEDSSIGFRPARDVTSE